MWFKKQPFLYLGIQVRYSGIQVRYSGIECSMPKYTSAILDYWNGSILNHLILFKYIRHRDNIIENINL